MFDRGQPPSAEPLPGESAEFLERALRDGLEPSWLGAMDGSYLSAEARLVLKDALATLGPREREVIRLRFVENLSHREIGERMGISQSYLSRVLRRALTSLRTTVGPLVLD